MSNLRSPGNKCVCQSFNLIKSSEHHQILNVPNFDNNNSTAHFYSEVMSVHSHTSTFLKEPECCFALPPGEKNITDLT